MATGRRSKKRTKIGAQFAPRVIEMLESPAYRELSLSGHRVLARLEIELAAHGGADNGKLPCTFDHFQQYGIHRDAIAPAIRETVALGFVEVTERGRAGNAEWRRPSMYRLTYRPTDQLAPTEEWRKIQTEVDARKIATAARKASSGAAKKNLQSRKPDQVLVRNPNRSKRLCSPESMTTGHSPESVTTSISRNPDNDRKENQQAPASGHSQASEAGRADGFVAVGDILKRMKGAA